MSKQKISNLLDTAVREFCFSGYQIYAECSNHVTDLSGGKTSYWPENQSVTRDSFFDIASITKALTATSILARWLDRKEIELSQTVSEFIPEFKKSSYENLTISELLSHSAGLCPWFPLYKETDKKTFVEWLLKRQTDIILSKPGEKTVYSDFSFMLLGLMIERRAKNLNGVFQEEVVKPLKLEGVTFGPLKDKNTVATEYCLYRNKLLCGEVFDENAFALGGVTAHAGLFASAHHLAPWCREWLLARKGKSSWLSEGTACLMTSPAKNVEGSTWGYGFDTKSPLGSSAGEYFSSESFGHLGYTGCSVWMDPVVDGFAIFLTNRVHPSRFEKRLAGTRRSLHNEIATAWRLKS